MGIFAFYNGFIYNEFFAIPLEIFGSCYEEAIIVVGNEKTGHDDAKNQDIYTPKQFGFERKPDCVYTLGVDPRWFQSDQNLAFTNNMKMKIAVILAILQMSLGIIMKGLNSIYFRKTIDFLFEFIPQIILLLALFGWMDILILAKWVEPKDVEGYYVDPNLKVPPPSFDGSDPYNKVHYTPAIITTMIDIFLAGASNKATDPQGKEFTKYNYVMEGQAQASIALLLIALVCVPTMLCVKPLILRS